MRDKQIEEMAKDMCNCCREAVTNKECDLGGCDGVRLHAEALYNAGYRKASDVATEIFEELKKLGMVIKVVCDGKVVYDFTDRLDELKKKYTEGEG